MNRNAAIKMLLKAAGSGTYLEIGVRYGTVFLPQKAARKIAVDPAFQISWQKKLRHSLGNFHSRYYAMASDDFFAREAPALFKDRPIDVAFIDGLHTYEQSRKDVENCLRYLSPGGAIVMHDCNPPTAAAALLSMDASAKAGSKAWCGDVWKVIVHLRAARPDLNVCVIDGDYGLGMIRKGAPDSRLSLSPQAIEALSYADLEKDRRNLLNLKPPKYVEVVASNLGHE